MKQEKVDKDKRESKYKGIRMCMKCVCVCVCVCATGNRGEKK